MYVGKGNCWDVAVVEALKVECIYAADCLKKHTINLHLWLYKNSGYMEHTGVPNSAGPGVSTAEDGGE